MRFLLDLLSSTYISYICRKYNLKDPIRILLDTLEIRGLIKQPFKAIEIFGMYGLRVTCSYIEKCSVLDFWEYDRDYVAFARIALRKYPVRYHCGDTILALKNCQIPPATYSLIVIDNPARGFGEYCEHFDVFPYIPIIADPRGCAILFNICYDPISYAKRLGREYESEWRMRRDSFYLKNFESLPCEERIKYIEEFYKTALPTDFLVEYSDFLPRSEGIGMMLLFVKAKEYSNQKSI